jgi:hypothetical protein
MNLNPKILFKESHIYVWDLTSGDQSLRTVVGEVRHHARRWARGRYQSRGRLSPVRWYDVAGWRGWGGSARVGHSWRGGAGRRGWGWGGHRPVREEAYRTALSRWPPHGGGPIGRVASSDCPALVSAPMGWSERGTTTALRLPRASGVRRLGWGGEAEYYGLRGGSRQSQRMGVRGGLTAADGEARREEWRMGCGTCVPDRTAGIVRSDWAEGGCASGRKEAVGRTRGMRGERRTIFSS